MSRETLQRHFKTMQAHYSKQKWPSFEERKALLESLKLTLLTAQQSFNEALAKDYGVRSEFDTVLGDMLPTLDHLNYTLSHLKQWMKPQSRRAGLMLMPSKIQVIQQPLGVVGIIVPWNFPLFLSLGPLITALAAGNKVMLKLSELTPHTNTLLTTLLAPVKQHVCVIEGGADISAQFSALNFDHLFFTGSTEVGRKVAQTAANNLTPITLELGGKSPVLVAPDIKIEDYIDSIIMGKSMNAGQICVAPDYVLLPRGQGEAFIRCFITRFQRYYRQLADYSAVISESHFVRLMALIEAIKSSDAQLYSCGNIDHQKRLMPVQLVLNPEPNSAVMSDEIFGPILPVIEYDAFEDAISVINQGERPLALYLMSNDQTTQQTVLQQTHSGGVCINDTLLHVGATDAPFGGVGNSGMGQYHGREGYDTFSNSKTVLHSPIWLFRSGLILRYKKSAMAILKKLFLR